MKKKILISMATLIGLVSLSSCDILDFGSSTSEAVTEASSVEVVDTKNVDGFTKAELSKTIQGFNRYYSESLGNQNILIVPIHLAADSSLGSSAYSGTWTDTVLDELSDMIFDTSDPESLVSYYSQASFNRLVFGGEVSELYNSTYTTSDLVNDDSMEKMFDMFDDAVEWIDENDSTVDIEQDYDQNGDGYIDNIHFMIDGDDSDDWSSNIWPHMYQTGNYPAATGEFPTVNTYSLSNLGHLDDAYTTIHEQGHIFGLQDYYNYSEMTYTTRYYGVVDYVGSADMQDNGMFDWNAYSKMNMGWIDPYYFDGTEDSATITIEPSGTSGDAIVVGQNWNGTAFDEYITLELFTKDGNNQYAWDDEYQAESGQSLGDGGVRVSHVDSRVATWLGGSSLTLVDDYATTDYNNYYLRYSNSFDSDDYNGYTFDDNKYHLLEVIQAGGTNEFGKEHNYYVDSDYEKTYLSEDDLFQTGDTFSMDDYGSEFFYNETTLNDGDSFPYEISFDSVTADSATITITKI
jgi:M6 family metalloprotease-like protein